MREALDIWYIIKLLNRISETAIFVHEHVLQLGTAFVIPIHFHTPEINLHNVVSELEHPFSMPQV